MKIDEFLNSGIVNKLFGSYGKNEWSKNYLKKFLLSVFNLDIEIFKERAVDELKIEKEKIIIKRDETIIEFYILNNEYPENILFVYIAKFERDHNKIYGITAFREDRILDLYCYPIDSFEISEMDIEGNIHHTVEKSTIYGIGNDVFDEFKQILTEDQYDLLIKEMLKRERLLVKNSIYKIF